MKKEDLLELRKVFFNLTDEERIQRDLYLKQFYDGTLYGPLPDDVYISKPGVKNLRSEAIANFDLNENPFLILEKKIKEEGLYDKPIIYTNDGRVKTYGQIYEEAKKFAEGLKKQGLKKGDTVACLFLNSIDEASVLFGALAIGVKVKYIDFTKGLNAIKEHINEGEVKGIVMDDMFKAMIPFIYKKDIPFIIADNDKEYSIFNISTLNKFIKDNNGEIEVENDKNAPALSITSSGTTGKPKPIVHSVYSINSGINKVMYEDFKLGEDTAIVKVIPSHIAMGVVGVLCSALYSETPVIMVKGKTAAACSNGTLDLIKNFEEFKEKNGLKSDIKLTLFFSPVFYKSLADNIDQYDDLSYLGTLLSAGSKLSPDVANYVCERLQTKGCYSKIVNAYGQNEMHLQATNNESGNKFGSVGTPTIGTNIVIVDDNFEIVGPNVEGRVLEQSDTTFTEYENMEEKTKDAFITLADGSKWFDTQDKGYIDNDGFVYITGRLSRSMVRYECKISLETIEDKFRKHNAIRDCVMIALEQENEEDNIPVLFIDSNNKKLSYEKIVSDLKRKGVQFSEYEKPMYVEFIDMPYLASQKPDIYKLTEYAKNKYLKEKGKKLIKK